MILLLALGAAVAAGLYFIWIDLQREKQRTNALGLHLRKLEGMVWSYNIQNAAAHHDEDDEDDEEEDDEDDEDEESNDDEVQESAEEAPVAQGFNPFNIFRGVPPQHVVNQPEPDVVHAHVQRVVFGFGEPQGEEPAEDVSTPQIEVVDENEEEDDEIPVSFDTSRTPVQNEVVIPENIEVDHIEDERIEDEPIEEEHFVEEEAHIEEVHIVDDEGEENLEEEEGEEKLDGEEPFDENSKSVRYYADNARNRKLGRVGQVIP